MKGRGEEEEKWKKNEKPYICKAGERRREKGGMRETEK